MTSPPGAKPQQPVAEAHASRTSANPISLLSFSSPCLNLGAEGPRPASRPVRCRATQHPAPPRASAPIPRFPAEATPGIARHSIAFIARPIRTAPALSSCTGNGFPPSAFHGVDVDGPQASRDPVRVSQGTCWIAAGLDARPRSSTRGGPTHPPPHKMLAALNRGRSASVPGIAVFPPELRPANDEPAPGRRRLRRESAPWPIGAAAIFGFRDRRLSVGAPDDRPRRDPPLASKSSRSRVEIGKVPSPRLGRSPNLTFPDSPRPGGVKLEKPVRDRFAMFSSRLRFPLTVDLYGRQASAPTRASAPASLFPRSSAPRSAARAVPRQTEAVLAQNGLQAPREPALSRLHRLHRLPRRRLPAPRFGSPRPTGSLLCRRRTQAPAADPLQNRLRRRERTPALFPFPSAPSRVATASTATSPCSSSIATPASLYELYEPRLYLPIPGPHWTPTAGRLGPSVGRAAPAAAPLVDSAGLPIFPACSATTKSPPALDSPIRSPSRQHPQRLDPPPPTAAGDTDNGSRAAVSLRLRPQSGARLVGFSGPASDRGAMNRYGE